MIELCDHLDCTGCSSCYNVCPKGCITMTQSDEGFLHPVIDTLSCIECGLCRKKCPILNPIDYNVSPRVYASWSLDESIRTTSSSGGMFSELSKFVFDKGGIVFGVIMNENLDAVHISARTMAEIEPMKGSKYFQSIIGDTYKETKGLLSKGEWVLYSGTPCQIAGLLRYLSPKVYPTLITLDMVCHGVPSSMAFKEYISKLELTYPNIVRSSYRFRSLDKWEFNASLISNNKRINIDQKDNVFMKMFLAGYLFRESCYNCRFTRVNRVSDITIADFWGIGKDIKFEHNTKQGVSLCLMNTNKGMDIFNSIQNSIFSEERRIEEAMVINHQLHSQSLRPKKGRDIAYQYFRSHSIKEINIKFFWLSMIRSKVGQILITLKLR